MEESSQTPQKRLKKFYSNTITVGDTSNMLTIATATPPTGSAAPPHASLQEVDTVRHESWKFAKKNKLKTGGRT